MTLKRFWIVCENVLEKNKKNNPNNVKIFTTQQTVGTTGMTFVTQQMTRFIMSSLLVCAPQTSEALCHSKTLVTTFFKTS